MSDFNAVDEQTWRDEPAEENDLECLGMKMSEEFDDPNYDGQGKSWEQETRDRRDMLGIVILAILVCLIIYPILGLIVWAVIA